MSTANAEAALHTGGSITPAQTTTTSAKPASESTKDLTSADIFGFLIAFVGCALLNPVISVLGKFSPYRAINDALGFAFLACKFLPLYDSSRPRFPKKSFNEDYVTLSLSGLGLVMFTIAIITITFPESAVEILTSLCNLIIFLGEMVIIFWLRERWLGSIEATDEVKDNNQENIEGSPEQEENAATLSDAADDWITSSFIESIKSSSLALAMLKHWKVLTILFLSFVMGLDYILATHLWETFSSDGQLTCIMIGLLCFTVIMSIITLTVLSPHETKTFPSKVQEPRPELTEPGPFEVTFGLAFWCGMVTPKWFPEHSFLGAPEWQTNQGPNRFTWTEEEVSSIVGPGHYEEAMSILGSGRHGYDYNRESFGGLFKYFSVNAFLIVFSIGMLLWAVTLGVSFFTNNDDEVRKAKADEVRERFLGYAKAIGNFFNLVLNLVLKAYLVYIFCRILLCETEFGEAIMGDWYVRFAMLSVLATSPTIPIFSWMATGFGFVWPWISDKITRSTAALKIQAARFSAEWPTICDAFGSTLVKFISEIPRYLGRLLLAWVVVLAVRDSLCGSSAKHPAAGLRC